MINVPYNLIRQIPKEKRIKLADWCNHRYKDNLKANCLNNYGMASLYSSIMNSLIDSSKLNNDTEIMPNNSYTIMLGIDLQEELLVALQHSQLILGTNNKAKNNHFKNVYMNRINHINLNILYIFNINQGITSVRIVSYADFIQWIKNIIVALDYDVLK